MSDEPQDDTKEAVFKKRTQRKGQIRKKPDITTENDSDDETTVVKKAKVVKEGALSASTKSQSKSADELVGFAFQSSGSQMLGDKDESVFRVIETETERDKDAQAIYLRNQKIQEELRASSAEDGKAPPAAEADSKEVYKGMSGYKQYVQKGAPDRTAGPIRATQHVRMSTHMDYAPDICKDYKETGYCGYGDNCKFMHDRGDYKTGWQIDRDWEAAQKSKRKALVSGKAEEDEDWTVKDEDDGLPFACFICRQPFTDPVVTKCGHYFCEDCALNHHKKSHKCAVCKEPTMGIFNTAAKIMKKRDEIAKAKADAEREEEERLRAETAYRSSNASSGGRSEHHFEQGEDAPAVVDD